MAVSRLFIIWARRRAMGPLTLFQIPFRFARETRSPLFGARSSASALKIRFFPESEQFAELWFTMSMVKVPGTPLVI